MRPRKAELLTISHVLVAVVEVADVCAGVQVGIAHARGHREAVSVLVQAPAEAGDVQRDEDGLEAGSL